MTELAYVQLGPAWSIARHVLDGFEWWCGEPTGWVSPASSWWALDPDCGNETFATLAAARRFARSRGWETP